MVSGFPLTVGLLAGARALEGDSETALQWMGAALAHPAFNDEVRQDLETTFAILRETLSDTEIEVGLAAGKSLDFDALVTSLLEQP